MGYDIYGNLLQRGHCEAHPDVPETYPCSTCADEYYEHQAQLAAEEKHWEELQREEEERLLWEFWSCHIEDPPRHPMEDITGGD